ncbi:MAG: threonine--tRNA ligase [Chlamydiales bacterium]|jgi:threonyl-tRNA synthetase|nr:threonine--tRNA ligase [Chlamydiales bacterium]
MLELFPNVIYVENFVDDVEFACDFLFQLPQNDQLLTLIEDRMRSVIKNLDEIESFEMMRQNAVLFIQEKGLPIMWERLNDKVDPLVTFIKLGDQYILSQEGEELELSKTPAFKLCDIAFVKRYINGRHVKVVRVKGVAFYEKGHLKQFLKQREMAALRDHQQIVISEKLLFPEPNRSTAIWHWLPNGSKLRHKLVGLITNIYRELEIGEFCPSPLLALQSALNEKYLRKQVDPLPVPIEMEGISYIALSSSVEYYISILQSLGIEQSLKQKYMQWATCLHEGEIDAEYGLLKSRVYTQDQGHYFCHSKSIREDLVKILQAMLKILTKFNIPYHMVLQIKKSSSMTSTKDWKQFVEALKWALRSLSIPFEIEERKSCFYGPRLEIVHYDLLGRKWDAGYVEADLFNKAKLAAKFKNIENLEVFRFSLCGSIERLFALLVEKHGKNVTDWLLSIEA